MEIQTTQKALQLILQTKQSNHFGSKIQYSAFQSFKKQISLKQLWNKAYSSFKRFFEEKILVTNSFNPSYIYKNQQRMQFLIQEYKQINCQLKLMQFNKQKNLYKKVRHKMKLRIR
ncbi:unnamed protein product [Paramecium octaurelia]|uniref:Uncharacterized protein n=1 Tax=Paramecium octaurelia TaxID=43137 RepID=A0A8S1UM34_PAROT|nr:unnamed protein product [Paramecium octaurelia]